MIYVLLPAYNEEASLDVLLGKFSQFGSENPDRQFELIVCDDGSTDKTYEN